MADRRQQDFSRLGHRAGTIELEGAREGGILRISGYRRESEHS